MTDTGRNISVRGDLRRFQEIVENQAERVDLTDFIEQYDLKQNDDGIQVPVIIVDLPEFVYARTQQGGVGQGDGSEQQGDPVQVPGEEGDGDGDGDGEGDEPGEGSEDHAYYDMDPEEFAEEMDEELDLDLEPKGKKVAEEIEGAFVETARTGPNSTLDLDYLYKEGLKRTLAMQFDEDYVREVMRVEGMDPHDVFEWARGESLPVSLQWIDREYDKIDETDKYASMDDIPGELTRHPRARDVENVAIRPDDERYRHPEIEEKKEKNVVVVNIRDVSGSMRSTKRELVERVFTPLDWYLQGKYDRAEFIYIAHDYEAWEVDREDFFGIQSGGGTKVSTAYTLAQRLLEERYPWSDWNRFVFGAGDGENSPQDTQNNLVDLMDDIDCNMHGYIEVKPSSSIYSSSTSLIEELENGVTNQTLATDVVTEKDDVIPTIKYILDHASGGE